MKITNDDQQLHGYAAGKAAKPSEKSAADFNHILEGTLATTAASESTVQPPAVIENVMPVQLQHMQPAQKPSTIDQIENMLDLLDQYRHELADPNSTLKDIQPLVESLQAAKNQLIPALDSIADGDRLKQILNETLITASTEVFKYNKGEYI
jgi:hypothetical protein